MISFLIIAIVTFKCSPFLLAFLVAFGITLLVTVNMEKNKHLLRNTDLELEEE